MDGGVDLEALYALVPAAEEEDLLEEVEATRALRDAEQLSRHRRCLSCWYLADGPGEDCCGVAQPQEPVAEVDDDDPPLSTAQALALLAHELGATVVSTQLWSAPGSGGPTVPGSHDGGTADAAGA